MDEKTKAFEQLMQNLLKDKEGILLENKQIGFYNTCPKCNQQYIIGTIHICPTWTQTKKK